MGYTTEFKGAFRLNRKLSNRVIASITCLGDGDLRPKYWPNGYCDWRVTEDEQGIEWNGAEKFYDWKVWLNIIIDRHLKPGDYVLNGDVEWSGETADDVGIIRVVDNVVTYIEGRTNLQDGF
jgi:hypothetical protein